MVAFLISVHLCVGASLLGSVTNIRVMAASDGTLMSRCSRNPARLRARLVRRALLKCPLLPQRRERGSDFCKLQHVSSPVRYVTIVVVTALPRIVPGCSIKLANGCRPILSGRR